MWSLISYRSLKVVNMKFFSIFFKRQITQTSKGGWPVIKRKILILKLIIYDRLPIVYTFYYSIRFVYYLAGTLLRRHHITIH